MDGTHTHWTDDGLLLVTGATGLVGSHVCQRARSLDISVRAYVRETSDTRLLEEWGVDLARGTMTEPDRLAEATVGVTHVVHCAAKVGDWGPAEAYRAVNVEGLQMLVDACRQAGTLRRFVHISSLGVYEARDHYGTDESESPQADGIDGYTLTKVEAEQLLLREGDEHSFPAVLLRPGFIYGPRDRTVLPRIVQRLLAGKLAYLGSPTKLINNTFVENLVDAVFLALDTTDQVGEAFNITDGRLVTKQEFVETIARLTDCKPPTRTIPRPVANAIAKCLAVIWKLRGKDAAPVLSGASVKFMGNNLDFCIDKARRQLGYDPSIDFAEAMQRTLAADE